MAITRLNHAVLYVRDARRSAAFYTEVLGLAVRHEIGEGKAIFLGSPVSDNDHDLGLFSVGEQVGASQAGSATVGLYHLAWQVDTLDELDRLRNVLTERGALVGASDHGATKSLYGRDADGLEFEIMWAVPLNLLDKSADAVQIAPLDLEKEKRRYGATTVSTG
jgi:catechol-2,3-dioxygenase